MSIATEKDKGASNRFALVRLRPARHVSNDLVLDSGIIYTMTFPFIPHQIFVSDVFFQEVETTSPADSQWNYNETTKELRIGSNTAPDEDDHSVIVYYRIFYTGETTRYLPEDPEDPSSTIREWQGRLNKYPSDKQTMRNITQGVFSIADTRVELSNTDDDFQQYLTIDDSFSNKEADVWQVINDVSNIRHSFQGRVKGPLKVSDKVVLPVYDIFALLSQPALMGDTADNAYYRRSSASFPRLYPNDHDTPIPYVVGKRNHMEIVDDSVTFSGTTGKVETTDGLYQARCTDFNGVGSGTSHNREWGVCRIKGSLKDQSFGSLTTITDSGVGRYLWEFSSVPTVEIGDTIKWTVGGTPFYHTVTHVGAFTHAAQTYNMITGFTFVGGVDLSAVMVPLKSLSIRTTDPDNPSVADTGRQIIQDRDYSITETVVLGNNTYINIDFVNNFEANLSGSFGPLTPRRHKTYFRITKADADVETHADILEDILDQVNMSVDSASFATAAAALDADARFTIPQFDEQDFADYLKYAQLVLSSTLGLLRLNTDQEVVYELLSTPSSTDLTDDSLVIQGKTTVSVDYNDIVTTMIGYNPHANDQANIDASETASATAESNKAKWLHDIDRVIRFRHVLERIDNRIDDLLKVRRSRRAIYSFSTATDNIDSDVGEDLQLDNDIVLGGSGSVDLKITGLDRSPSRTIVTADDLGELD